MRIAFIAQPFDRMDPPVQGGSLAIWIYQVARRCAARGHPTFVLANHGAPLRQGGTVHEGVEYVYTPTAPNTLVNRGGETLSRLARRAGARNGVPGFAASWRDAGYALAAARELRRREVDAVLVMNYSQFVPIIRRVYPRCRIYLYMQCEWLSQLDRAAMGERIAASDMVSGCSEYIRDLIAARFPEHAQKCVTLHNAGIPPAPVSVAREPRRVLFVGRVSPEKGVHVLIEAFHRVLSAFPDARLHVVGGIGSAPLEFLVGLSADPHVAALRRFYTPAENGTDPYFAALQRLAGAEFGRRIVFEGRVDHDRTAEAYGRAALLVNPSLSESFGMSLVEAGMHGLPVVATRVGGMPFIVNDGETGLLVDPADPDALARAMCALLADPERAACMGEAGRRRALERFSWDRTADTLLEQCQTLLA